MPEAYVHPSAFVEEGVTLGADTKIWHFCHLLAGARVGSNCVLGQNVFIGARAVVGDSVKIQNNVSVYDRVIIEDDVFLGPSCVFTNVVNPRAFVDRKTEYKETRVQVGSTIGANATILCGVTLGKYCFVGAGALVTRNVPDYALVYGNPARHQGWVSRLGHVLDATLTCPESGEQYQLIDDLTLAPVEAIDDQE